MIGVWSWYTFVLYIFIMFYFYLTTKKICAIPYEEARKKHNKMILFILFPVVVAAFRTIDSSGLGGTDMCFYMETFHNSLELQISGTTQLLGRGNPLFYFILHVIRLFTNNEYVFLTIIYAIIVWCQYYFFSETYYTINSMAPLFFLMYYYLRSFSILKFMLGLAILSIAYVQMYKGKRRLALLFSLLAAFIHSSLLLATGMIICYLFFEKLLFQKKILVIMIGLVYFGMYIFREPLYQYFADTDFSNYLGFETAIMAHFTTVICGALCLIFFNKLRENGVNKFFLFAIFFDVACIPLQNEIGFFRLHYIFYLPRLYMWGKIIDVIKTKVGPAKHVELISSILIISWTIFRFVREYSGALLMPYVFSLF